MTDQPGREPEQRLPARRAPSDLAPADRFSAPPSAHPADLSAERVGQIVRQSSNARWASLLAVIIVVLFVILYYFYELGAPLGLSKPRLVQQTEVQQVTAVEAGYNLYIANCARCHGPGGKGTNEGYIAPPLNDPMKLYVHLSPTYLKNVLTVGGRYVCGNANSLMPIWSDVNGGPLNYRQIEELIAFLRAPKYDAAGNVIEYTVKDAALNEPIIGADGKVITFEGWIDPNFKPDPQASAVPNCYLGDGGQQTAAPAASLPPDAPSFTINAQNIAYDVKALTVAAGTPFAIKFNNQDSAGVLHNVDIRTADGTTIQSTPTIDGGASTTYVYTALQPGTYTFICKIHPIPGMTGTLTVK
jgi:plastocyanin/mono/diheme cytochrome c family protein